MSMIQFTRTEIRWLIGVVENVIDTNKTYVESTNNGPLERVVKLQTDNWLFINRRLKAVDEDVTIKRIEITK